MKIFQVQTDLTSYTYSVIKILVCLFIIFLGIQRNRFIHNPSTFVNVVLTILCFQLAIASILCIYISIGELFHTHSNRKNDTVEFVESKDFSVETITQIVSESDIVEFEIYYDKRIIKIGASAVCEYASNVFENKLYYIEDTEYSTPEHLAQTLRQRFPKGVVPVVKIDGLKQSGER